MPARDQTFEDSGDQGRNNKGGQRIPGRKKKDGSRTEDEDVTEEKEYVREKGEHKDGDKMRTKCEEGEENCKCKTNDRGDTKCRIEIKERPAEDETKEETEAVEGYGAPTKGRYNAEDKGYKAFGTVGQGEDKEGLKDTDSREDVQRVVSISVTALEDQGSDTILLETGNYEFLEEYTWEDEEVEEDSAATLTISAVLGLIGMSMI